MADRDQIVADRDQLVAALARLVADRELFDSELKEIKSSIMWKLTYPVQVLGQFVRKLLRNTR